MPLEASKDSTTSLEPAVPGTMLGAIFRRPLCTLTYLNSYLSPIKVMAASPVMFRPPDQHGCWRHHFIYSDNSETERIRSLHGAYW